MCILLLSKWVNCKDIFQCDYISDYISNGMYNYLYNMYIIANKIMFKGVIIFKGISHIIIAISLYLSLFDFNLSSIVAITIGSLFPDIDTPYSKLGKYNIFSYVMKHRGITHTLLGMSIFSYIAYEMFGDFVWGFIFGYIIHLLVDGLTPMGIMWLYPFKKKYYSIWKRKSPYKSRT